MKGFLSSKKKALAVRFEPWDHEPTDAEFYHEFSKYNESSLWICFMYMMTCFVQLSLEIDDTIFDIASHTEESCVNVALEDIPWKHNETTKIFYPSIRMPCTMYDYNVKELSNMTYKNAVKFLADKPKPPVIYCSVPLSANNFSWSTDFIGTCRGAQYRKLIRGSKLVGIALGSLIFGTVADLFGRKVGMYIAVFLYFGGLTVQQLIDNFIVIKILTGVKGMGKAGLENIALILFLEYCSKNNRAILVLYIRLLSPCGTIMGIHMKKHLYGFCPELRFIIGIPSLILIFYVWYVPESPRWSLSYCRKEEAWNFLHNLGTPISHLHLLKNLKLNKRRVLKENLRNMLTISKFIKTLLLSTYLLFLLLTVEFSKKQYMCLRGHLTPYAHHSLLTMAKMISFMNVLPPVIMFRRRLALVWFFWIITIQLCITLFVDSSLYYILNMLMMLSIYSVRSLFLLYICEIFPTCLRATSYGFIHCLAMLFYYAHYMYELKIHVTSLSIQNIVVFVASCFALMIVYFLPEVKHQELSDYKRYRRDYEELNPDTPDTTNQ